MDTDNKYAHFTLFILIDYPIHIDTKSMELSILYFKWLRVKISINDVHVFLFLKIVFILSSKQTSADPDEMPPTPLLFKSTHLQVSRMKRVNT